MCRPRRSPLAALVKETTPEGALLDHDGEEITLAVRNERLHAGNAGVTGKILERCGCARACVRPFVRAFVRIHPQGALRG